MGFVDIIDSGYIEYVKDMTEYFSWGKVEWDKFDMNVKLTLY